MLCLGLIGCDGAQSADHLAAGMSSEVFYQLTSGSGGRVIEIVAQDRGVIATVRVTGASPPEGLAPDTEYWRLAVDAADDLAMGYLGQLRVAARDDCGDARVLSEKDSFQWIVPRRFRLDQTPQRMLSRPVRGTVLYALETDDGQATYYLRFAFDRLDSPPTVDWFLNADAYGAVVASAKHAGVSPASFEGAAVDFGAGADAELVKTAYAHRYAPLY